MLYSKYEVLSISGTSTSSSGGSCSGSNACVQRNGRNKSPGCSVSDTKVVKRTVGRPLYVWGHLNKDTKVIARLKLLYISQQ